MTSEESQVFPGVPRQGRRMMVASMRPLHPTTHKQHSPRAVNVMAADVNAVVACPASVVGYHVYLYRPYSHAGECVWCAQILHDPDPYVSSKEHEPMTDMRYRSEIAPDEADMDPVVDQTETIKEFLCDTCGAIVGSAYTITHVAWHNRHSEHAGIMVVTRTVGRVTSQP